MKISTKTILPATLFTLTRRANPKSYLPFGRPFKGMVIAALLLLVLSANNKAFAVARTGTLSAGTVPAAGSVICVGATNQILYSFKIVQTGNSNTLNSFTFTTSGTATAADITGYTLYWNTTNNFAGATSYGTVTTGTGPGSHTLTGSKSLTTAAAGWFFFLVANISPSATLGDNITVTQITNAIGAATFSFSSVETYAGSAGAPSTLVISPSPTVSATTPICPGSSATLTGTPTGGTWASSNTALATINSSTGSVTGISPAGGVATITYTQGGCPGLASQTIKAGPTALTVTPATSYTICPAGSVTPTASASSPTITLLSQNFNSGLTGQVGGTWTIVNSGATSPYNWNVVNPPGMPSTTITGDGSAYAESDPDAAGPGVNLNTQLRSPSFSTLGLTSATLTFNQIVASFPFSFSDGDFNLEVDYSTNGGSSWTQISNYVGAFTGGTTWSAATPTVTIPLPAGMLNQANVTMRWYYNSIWGDWWAIDNIVVTTPPATLPATAFTWAGPSGVSCSSACFTSTLSPTAGGLNVYTTTATYNGCTASQPISVNVVVPQTILSNAPLCAGSSTTTLTDPLAGGTWSSANTGVAVIGSSSGTLTGVSPGVATITYTVPPGCTITAQATVNPVPNIGSFNTPSATNPCTGSGSVVSVNASTLGTASYTVTYSLSGANTGTGSATLTTAAGLGTFTTSALANAGSTTVTITSISNLLGCSINVTSGNTVSFTVNPGPAAIGGTLAVCAGQVTTLSETSTGGTWSSSNTALATVDGSGNVTGVAGGTALISYSVATGCAATQSVTVNTAPAITGITTLCVGQTSALANAITGGTWSSSNNAVVTIDTSAGTATSLAVGTSVISYAVTGSCTATTPFTVTNTPGIFTVTGGGTYCAGGTGVHVGLTGSTPGVSYQPFIGATAIGSPVTGTGGVIDFGFETSTGTYIVVANPGTACATTMTGTAIVSTNPLPALFTVGGGGNYCAGGIGVPVTLGGSAFGFSYQLFNGATPVGSALFGSSTTLNFGLQTASGTYSVVALNPSTGCTRTMTGSATVVTNPAAGVYLLTGGGSFCAGGTGVPVGISGSDAGSTYTLFRGASIVYTTTGTGAALNFGLQNIGGTYTVTAVTPQGCTATMSGSAVVVVNPLPTANNVTGGGAYCAGASGVHVGLNGSSVGVLYQLNNGGPVGAPMIGTSFPLDFGFQTVAGTYTVSAINSTTGCANNMTGSVNVTVNPLPVNTYSVTGGGSYCTGGTGFPIGLNGSTSGIRYQLVIGTTPVGVPVTGSGGAISFGTITGAGTYTVLATNTTTGCSALMLNSTSIIVNNPPPAFSVLGGGSYCTGGTGVNVVLNGSTTGVKYQLYNGAFTVGSQVLGTGFTLNFGLQTAAGSYNVVATDTLSGCTSNMTGSASVVVNPLPNVYTLTGGGGYCTGTSGIHVGLSGSDLNVNYTMSISGTPSGIFAGTGAPLDFGLETAIGNYTATAVNTLTGCTNTMLGFSSVSVNALPSLFTVTSSGNSYCAGGLGDSVGLSGSVTGTNYQLYLNGVALGAPVAGTNLSLFFGRETAAGNYTVIATTTATGCTGTMSGSANISVTPLPTAYTVTGGGSYCTGGSGVNITLNGSSTGVNYQLFTAGSSVGGVVGGTGTPLNFGPVTAAGSYTILATNPITTCTVNMFSSASVSVNPLPAVQPISGGGSYCAGNAGVVVGMSTSTVGINYQLFNGVATAGSPVPGTGSSFNFGLEPAGTYSVVATNASTGCVSNMSGTVTVTMNPVPVKDTVLGGGSYCSGGSGVDVRLNTTSTGVNYQLYNGTITVGFPVAGTGTSYDFGNEIAGGSYTVVATDGNGCMNNMYGSAVVVINPLPGAYFVAGGGGRCPAGASLPVLLNGSDLGITYQLQRDGGNIGTPVAGTGVFLNFGTFATPGVYTVIATNTATGCTKAMNGSTTIFIVAPPAVDTVTGGGNFCPGGTGVSVTLNTSSAGVNYQLYHDGFITGTAMAGTGDVIDFGMQTATGAYTVVATDSGSTCSSNMFGSVNVGHYPVPAAFTVSGGGSFCPGGTGLPVIIGGSETGVTYQLVDGSAAVGSPVSGTGSSINFGAQTATGSYTVVATNTATTCTNNMTGSATVANYPLPATFAVTGGGTYCIGGSGVAVNLAGSAVGINYQLYHNGSITGGSFAGTGSAINFGMQTAAGNYTVVATNATTGCMNGMTDTAVITIGSLPAAHTVGGSSTNYCAGGAGVDVYLTNSDLGINYQLYRGTTMVGVPVTGTGSAIDFGMQTMAGTYTMVGIDAVTGCMSNMSGSASITIDPLPVVNNVIGGGSYCNGSGGVHIGVDGSMAGVSYQLQNGSASIGTAVAGTGAALDLGAQTLAGSYNVVATNMLTGCSSNMSGSATVVINSLPGTYTVTGGGSYCAGGDGVTVGLSGSDIVGVSYQLMRSGAAIGAPVAATGGSLSFGMQTLAGTYTVMATNTTTSCTANMASSANVVINALPSVYTLTGGGNYCTGGTGVAIGLSGTTSGIKYQLYRAGVAVGSSLTGTGGTLSFGLQTAAGAYTVVATNDATTCISNMAGTANIIINPLPIVNNVTGGGNYCPGTSGVHIGIDGSTTGVLYQLALSGTATGSAISGTGSPLDLGLHTGAGTYTVKATNAATGCISNMAGSATITLGTAVTPTVSITTGVGDTVCAGTLTTFSASATNGGTAPVYHWSVNGVSASFGGSYTYTPSNGDNVSITLTSNASCATPASVNSSLVMSVLDNALPSVAVSTLPGNVICQGTVVNYTANPEYGGTAPLFTWLKNGVSVGAGPDYSYTPADSDVVYCQMTSNYPCRLANIVSSNNVLMHVDMPVIPIVTITASPGSHVSIGDLVTLTATVENGGAAPTYQWYVNGIPVADAVTPVLTSNNFQNGDSVTLQVTSSGTCSGLVGFNSLRIYTNVGVKQVGGNNSNIALVPNPNNGQFTVKGSLGIVTDEEVSMEVYDMLGQVVYKNTVMTHNGNINEKVQLTGTIANGMYILNLHSASQSNIFHFVVEQ